MSDFTAPKVARGRLTNFRTGNFLEFIYNPVKVGDRKGVNLAEDAVPGFSDPMVRFASGKARILTFSLQLCGESRIRKYGNNIINGAENNADFLENAGSFSIAGEIEWYQSMEYPVDPSLPGSDGGLDKFVFTMGRLYPGVLCYVAVDVQVTQFDPELNPTMAEASLTLTQIAYNQQWANHVWSPPIEGFRV